MKIKRFLKGFGFASEGIASAISSEINFKVQLGIALVAVASGFLLHISKIEWCLLVFAIGWVLMAELFNTAVEALTDHVSPGRHPSAKLVKDLSAGAVLISAIGAALIGLIILGTRIINIYLPM